MALFDLATSFKDVTMNERYMKCNIRFSRFIPRFKMAQEWLDREIVKNMKPVVPYKTGKLLNQILMENETLYGTGRIRTVPISPLVPYGRKLYPGINPKTGLPYHWTNPLTQPRWGTYAVQNFKPEYMKGVKQIILKGSKPNG